MSEKIFDSHIVAQVGIVVKDIEKTSAAFARAFGMETPEWFMTDGYDKAETEFRGKASEARSKLAFFHFGSLDIELIEPNEEPSTWREHLEEKGEGIHHLAFVIKDMKDYIGRAESSGMTMVQKGEYDGGRYAYVDALPDLKMIVELLEND
jgi:methylmalonyl-CoA/ethylmalonyl-CoA epimerase